MGFLVDRVLGHVVLGLLCFWVGAAYIKIEELIIRFKMLIFKQLNIMQTDSAHISLQNIKVCLYTDV